MIEDESNDKVFKGYVKAKLEAIHIDISRLCRDSEKQYSQITNNAKDIVGIKSTSKIQMSIIMLIITALIGGFVKLLFF